MRQSKSIDGNPQNRPQVLDFYKHQRCQTLPARREKKRRKLGDQPTPEKSFPEVVPILRECGKSCVEGSPKSLKDIIHIAHAFEDLERCCLQTAFGTIRRQSGHSRNLLYTSLRQAPDNHAVRQARWTVPAEHDLHEANRWKKSRSKIWRDYRGSGEDRGRQISLWLKPFRLKINAFQSPCLACQPGCTILP